MLAEAQRQQHRREEARRRADAAAQREYERARRDAERAAAQGQKEALRAYRQSREADAARRTAEVEAQVAAVRGTLAAGLRGPAFRLAELTAPVPPFDPGQLGVPVPLPEQSWYALPPLTGPAAYDPAARRQWDGQAAQARARFEQDWYAAQAAEQQRLAQLAEYRAEFDRWAAGRQAAAARAAELADGLSADRPGAVAEYFAVALGWRADWPEGFPNAAETTWDAGARQLVVDWPLPDFSVVPAVARHRYVKTDDRDAEVARPAGERRALYREVVAQCALRVLAEAFRADDRALLHSVAVNGLVEAVDPATGREESRCLVSVAVERDAFLALDLERVSAVDCLVEALHGRLSARPDRPDAVPAQRPAAPAPAAAAAGGDGGGEEGPDLFTMDPIAFEELIAELFRRRGLRTRTTARSGDEGVDVLAEDPDPITGGQIVIQAKRYRHTVPPTAVRDLDATMQRQGANRGILVTTSGFGPGSRRWVEGRPLTLVDGPMLVALLRENGLAGRLGARPGTPAADRAPAPAAAAAPAAATATELSPGQNAVLPPAAARALTVHFGSAGAEADLALLLLGEDGRVRGDADFVFYHQRTAALGAVRLDPRQDGPAGRRSESAVLRLGDLPAEVRRIAVSITMDVDQGLACDRLAGAELRLAADGAAWSFRPPADPAVSAMLVAEVYRHRAGGGPEVWKVRAVGQGWSDGLAGLARAHGVDVA
ncbi:restriction endonuclease [Kitasatospora sp. NPDC059571]|uniref:restriction endonuclease n=1 Tax=Kitasatospora sp. NPDC059571 TaxID=3346871 RepID=UPI0036829DED